MDKLLGTVKFADIDFDCYGEVDRADRSVGYNGYVSIAKVKIKDVDVTEVIQPSLITHFEDELHYELC